MTVILVCIKHICIFDAAFVRYFCDIISKSLYKTEILLYNKCNNFQTTGEIVMKALYVTPECEVLDIQDDDVLVTSLGDDFYQDTDELIVDPINKFHAPGSNG